MNRELDFSLDMRPLILRISDTGNNLLYFARSFFYQTAVWFSVRHLLATYLYCNLYAKIDCGVFFKVRYVRIRFAISMKFIIIENAGSNDIRTPGVSFLQNRINPKFEVLL